MKIDHLGIEEKVRLTDVQRLEKHIKTLPFKYWPGWNDLTNSLIYMMLYEKCNDLMRHTLFHVPLKYRNKSHVCSSIM